ncbi:Glutamine rich 2 [Fasciola gigantica]|uniref:Glutamine rich 2 n=1 Tax=Fasciola gigantica TaxID=46835 RepID=A0A504YJZ0_FASGI|nr:Glutamine rich 2 [Fasciola gigantica]
MSAEVQSYRKVKLTKLLETSLGAPEPGCVNFNLLRLMLSTIINHLKIEEVEAEVDGEILDTLDATPHPKENREEGFRTIQDRLRTLENQMDTLNELPNSRELLDKVFPSSTDKSHLEVQTNQDQRRVSELWQSVQMKRRVDATEEGLSRLSSLTDDLLDQIKRLSDENKRLSIALEEAKKGSDLNDKLMDLERKLLELEKRQLQDESLLKNVVHMDALRGLVFWHSLGAAITGIDYITAYANAADKLATIERSAVEKKSDHGLVYKWPENKLACPDPDLSSTLRKLGIVASGFDNVLQRIDRLEELIGKKADREELTGLGVPPELLDRLAQLETAVKELAKEREKPVSSQSVINGKAILDCVKTETAHSYAIQNDNETDAIPTQNKKLIKTMQDTLAVLQKQIAQMHQLITTTQAEMKGVREQFADLQQFAEDIDVRKVDGAQMDAELMKVSG